VGEDCTQCVAGRKGHVVLKPKNSSAAPQPSLRPVCRCRYHRTTFTYQADAARRHGEPSGAGRTANRSRAHRTIRTLATSGRTAGKRAPPVEFHRLGAAQPTSGRTASMANAPELATETHIALTSPASATPGHPRKHCGQFIGDEISPASRGAPSRRNDGPAPRNRGPRQPAPSQHSHHRRTHTDQKWPPEGALTPRIRASDSAQPPRRATMSARGRFRPRDAPIPLSPLRPRHRVDFTKVADVEHLPSALQGHSWDPEAHRTGHPDRSAQQALLPA